MKEFTFTLIAIVNGIGAASGLLYEQDKLKIVSDDSEVLYVYDLKEEVLAKISLREDGKLIELQEKALKPDYESITRLENEILIFGSGSSSNRNILAKIKDTKPNSVEITPLDEFYDKLRKVTGVGEEDFNIEGAIAKRDLLLLFNRGNGPNAKNGIFRIKNWQASENIEIEFIPIQLPVIADVPFGFTDAIQVGEEVYFLASAETGGSTYHDGEVLGSIIGILDGKTFELKTTKQITNKHKLEGIVLYEKTEDSFVFLLCEDPDDGGSNAKLFKLELKI